LMVCLGNICRSPMAEGILRAKVDPDKIEVDSAGTSNYHINQQPDARMMATAKQHGIDISMLRGRQFTVDDFDNFDYIFVMDKSNYSDVLALARSEADRAKVDLILNQIHPGKNQDVPDPYYGGDAGFENVFNLLDESTNRFIEKLN